LTAEELHLFILWNKVGSVRDAALRRIGETLSIRRVFHVHWRPDIFSDNLTRFYGEHLPPGCGKEESCGIGPFILIVVRDDEPQYAVRDTTRGPASVNTRLFDLKSYLRSVTGGGLPVHATNTLRETNHDLALLLGLSVSEFESVYPGSWDGEIIDLRRDISGTGGWASYHELFAMLNATVNYVVLRNFDDLPDKHQLELHGDVDLLVENYADAILVANAKPMYEGPHCVLHAVVIAGQDIPFDFRYVGDDYYDRVWQRHILASRRLIDGGFYVPNAENHFFSLLYHAAVHKESIAPDYADKLKQLALTLGIDLPSGQFFDNPRQLRALLNGFMLPRRYRFTRPQDPSVHFRRAVALGSFQRWTESWLPNPSPAPPPPVPRLSNQPAVLHPTLLRSLGLPAETTIVNLDDNPTMLPGCCTQLPDDGLLVVIVTNSLGIRQFNGLGNGLATFPYASLYGLASGPHHRILTRRQLIRDIEAAGLPAQRYYYPFPDHKQPKAILTEAALQESGFDAANLLALMASRDPTGRMHPAFFEPLVWQNIISDGLLPNLANTFVVIAAKNEATLAKLDSSWLARTFTPERLPSFATETTFRRVAHDRIIVEKHVPFPGESVAPAYPFGDNSLLVHYAKTMTDYVPGDLYVTELQKRLARGEGIASVVDWAADWLNLLRTNTANMPPELPGAWLDAVPQNFIRSTDGTLHRIDDEWELTTPIPRSWLVIRGLSSAFGAAPTSPALAGMSLREVICIVAASAQINIEGRDFAPAFAQEARLRSVVFGQDENKILSELAMHFAHPPRALINSPTQREILTTECEQLTRELARVKATVSWRITAPLRVIWNACLRLVGRHPAAKRRNS